MILHLQYVVFRRSRCMEKALRVSSVFRVGYLVVMFARCHHVGPTTELGIECHLCALAGSASLPGHPPFRRVQQGRPLSRRM